jgi:iron(III) transport system ATP-binding protein
MSSPFLTVKSLCKSYPNQKAAAVDNISFEVKKEKIVAIIGESGCGKSTLLQLIAGLLEPDSGEVRLNGELVKPPSQQLIAGNSAIKMVFQQFNLQPSHTIQGNLEFALRLESKTNRLQRSEELAELCKLQDLLHKKPRELSGGQQQRVALAVALSTYPQLLLLDEPFSHLDAMYKQEMRSEVLRIIKSTGITAIMVTHDAKDALSVADEIIVIRHGKAIQIGTPKQLYETPQTTYTAHLTGEANIISESILQKYQFLDKQIKGKLFCIRPEDITLAKQGGIPIKITQQFYFGSHYRFVGTDELKNEWFFYDAQPIQEKQVKININKLIEIF